MNEVLAVDPKILEFINNTSMQIRSAEESLGVMNFVEAAHGSLTWGPAGKRHRILLNGKILADSKVADRIKAIKDLPGLVEEINRVGLEMIKELEN